MGYRIPFNKPFTCPAELEQVGRCLEGGDTAGDNYFTRQCQQFLQQAFSAPRVLLTTSCTSALEMAALLCDISPGDEIILPAYTFVSTANAFLLRGGVPKFVDIRADTLNLDEAAVKEAITPRTKAIVPVHYAGVACEMDSITAIAKDHDLLVVEDAAQGVNATYKGAYLGTLGELGAYSFHATKNFSCGEGGALVINDRQLIDRAEIIREKGTDRSRYHRGEVDKYTWIDVGSSYVLADILAALLLVQLQHMDEITRQRRRVYEHYLYALQPLADRGFLALPAIPAGCGSNYHMFYAIAESLSARTELLQHLKEKGIYAVFHYVPLHTAPMGRRFGYRVGMLPTTEFISDRLLRLPMFPSLTPQQIEEIASEIRAFYGV